MKYTRVKTISKSVNFGFENFTCGSCGAFMIGTIGRISYVTLIVARRADKSFESRKPAHHSKLLPDPALDHFFNFFFRVTLNSYFIFIAKNKILLLGPTQSKNDPKN